MAKSIMQQYKYCYLCGKDQSDYITLEKHHCLHGTARRRTCEKYGLTVWLCHECHMDLHDRNTEKDRELQQKAQRVFERKIGTREEFRREFGKSYL